MGFGDPAANIGVERSPRSTRMRLAALYDIHGNLPALEATLSEVDAGGFDLIVVGGDVALGPMPRETLDLLIARGPQVRFLRGNCDRDMAATSSGAPQPGGAWEARLRWAAERITPIQRELLGALPPTLTLEIDGLGAVLFCHGTPRSDDEIITRHTPDRRLIEVLTEVRERVVVCGHTHVQFDRHIGDRRLVNAGSVGLPYEGRPGAYWAALGPEVELRRTPYDLERAVQAMRSSGFPDVDEFTRRELLEPRSAAEATEFFERIAEERARSQPAI
jgi:putative phosphoesterase